MQRWGDTIAALQTSDPYFRFHYAFLTKYNVLLKVTAVTGNAGIQELKDSSSSLCSPEDSQESVPLSSSLNNFFMNIILI